MSNYFKAFLHHWKQAFKILKNTSYLIIPAALTLNLLTLLSMYKEMTMNHINMTNGLDVKDGVILVILGAISLIVHLLHRALLQSMSKVGINPSHLIEKVVKNHFSYLFTLAATLLSILITFIPLLLPFIFISISQISTSLSSTFGAYSSMVMTLGIGIYALVPFYCLQRISYAIIIQLFDYELSPMQCLRCSLRITHSDFAQALFFVWIPITLAFKLCLQLTEATLPPLFHSWPFTLTLLLPLMLSLHFVHFIKLGMKPGNAIQKHIQASKSA